MLPRSRLILSSSVTLSLLPMVSATTATALPALAPRRSSSTELLF
ncbi:hypothetical protein FOVG_19818 [Fusarium oxysporum f. sp. pisi HDV247]|uniref:Uncharacterized protein n=1 Tax=Fusarium oxysporum f. sp. pisi HDV247 TaxID=1080344 RepID=W9NF32_FUSOX|nr:hypothetical protein FOVG_19818 [Fusarium oxysporum f. sp. pisi HDV247]